MPALDGVVLAHPIVPISSLPADEVEEVCAHCRIAMPSLRMFMVSPATIRTLFNSSHPHRRNGNTVRFTLSVAASAGKPRLLVAAAAVAASMCRAAA